MNVSKKVFIALAFIEVSHISKKVFITLAFIEVNFSAMSLISGVSFEFHYVPVTDQFSDTNLDNDKLWKCKSSKSKVTN